MSIFTLPPSAYFMNKKEKNGCIDQNVVYKSYSFLKKRATAISGTQSEVRMKNYVLRLFSTDICHS